MDLDAAVPTQEALLGGIHVWRLHDHAEQLAAVRSRANAEGLMGGGGVLFFTFYGYLC